MADTLGRLIQFKQGKRIALPQLKVGEPGFCDDDNTLWVGSNNGNQQYAKQEEVNAIGDEVENIGIDYTDFKSTVTTLPEMISLPIPSGFSNDSIIRYEKDVTSEVSLYLFLNKTEDFVSNQTLLVGALPAGYRPSANYTETAMLYSNTGVLIPNSFISVLVTTNGEIRVSAMQGGNFVNAKRVYGVSLKFRARN